MNHTRTMTPVHPGNTTRASGVRIAIVFHSGYGHTARQAQAVKEGVPKEDAEKMIKVFEGLGGKVKME